jgi:hypothetical protein
MFKKNKKEEQSGFSVLSTEELYEINGGESENEEVKLPENDVSRGPHGSVLSYSK